MNRGVQSNNKTGFKGVSYRKDKGKYEARIKIGGKMIHLGYTKTAEESNNRYIDASAKYFGEYGRSVESAIIEAQGGEK